MTCIKYKWKWSHGYDKENYVFFTSEQIKSEEDGHEYFEDLIRENRFDQLNGFRGYQFDILDESEIPIEQIEKELKKINSRFKSLEKRKHELLLLFLKKKGEINGNKQ